MQSRTGRSKERNSNIRVDNYFKPRERDLRSVTQAFEMMQKQPEVSSESVKRAFRAAKLIKFSGVPAAVVTIVLSVGGFAIHAALGMLIIAICLLSMVATCSVLFVQAKCPKCGVRWWDNTFVPSVTGSALRALIEPSTETGRETEDFKCRRCGLEIGPYLR